MTRPGNGYHRRQQAHGPYATWSGRVAEHLPKLFRAVRCLDELLRHEVDGTREYRLARLYALHVRDEAWPLLTEDGSGWK